MTSKLFPTLSLKLRLVLLVILLLIAAIWGLAARVAGIVQDGESLEVDYPKGVVVNSKSGASAALRKYPPSIEQIFECGGLPQFAYERYLRETALAGQPGQRGS